VWSEINKDDQHCFKLLIFSRIGNENVVYKRLKNIVFKQ